MGRMPATQTLPKDLHGFLDPNDAVAISFWIISISMVAATCFFLMESNSVATHWKTSMNVGALVTLVAAVHYFYMREFWITIHMSPILYRYIDWSITVPLQMIEFYLILSAVDPSVSKGMFWRLLLGTVLMLAFGYAGEAQFIPAMAGFVMRQCGWHVRPAGQCVRENRSQAHFFVNVEKRRKLLKPHIHPPKRASGSRH